MSNSDLVGSNAAPAPASELRPGQPRSERDAVFLQRFDAWMRLPIIVAAILPIVIVPKPGGWGGIVVEVVSWLVFVVDYVVHARHQVHFARTRFGAFDLFIVVATAPWFLIPGAQPGRFVVFLRLARLARIAMASRASRRLFEQLGRVALVAAGVTLTGSFIAYYSERPTNPEFATAGDALWWGIVTLTTVGYGDIVPKTTTGRWAGVMIMLTGIAVLGLLSGSLASFFRLDRRAPSAAATDGVEGGANVALDDNDANIDEAYAAAVVAGAEGDPLLRALTDEVSALRRQVEALTERLAPVLPDRAQGHSPPGDAAPG